MGYYFGLWARCLKDELKKKICNDCHVASSALVGEKMSAVSADAETTCGAQEADSRHTTSDPEDGGGGDGRTRTHSNAAEQTPPDRWNVKMCAFQQKGSVVLSHVTTRHTKKKKKITNWQ